MDKRKCFVSRSFFYIDKIPNIKICYMVSEEHPGVIEGGGGGGQLLWILLTLRMIPFIIMVMIWMNRVVVV